MILINLTKTVCAVFLLTCLFSFTPNIDPATTIVVVDGKALLVDINEYGQIVTTYMEVPEYFESTKDHDTKVSEAKESYTRLSKAQMDQIRFIALADKGWDLDEFMVNNIADLATHYQQTYANQIEITAAKNNSNADKLDYNISKIKNLLATYGVSEKDIVIRKKKDLGDEPTQFVKMVSNLKRLAVQ